MNMVLALLIAYLVVSLGYALFSMKTTRSNGMRVMALLYLLASVGLALYFYNQLLSRPRPIDQEFFSQATEAVVLATRERDGESIYLWLQLPKQAAPAYYVMPWSGQAAEELEIAQLEAGQQGGTVVMKHPFQRNQRYGIEGDEKDPMFYSAPPERPPLKEGEAERGAPRAIEFHAPAAD
jgi:hypothetical protein